MNKTTARYAGTFLGAGVAAVLNIWVRRLFIKATAKD